MDMQARVGARALGRPKPKSGDEEWSGPSPSLNVMLKRRQCAKSRLGAWELRSGKLHRARRLVSGNSRSVHPRVTISLSFSPQA